MHKEWLQQEQTRKVIKEIEDKIVELSIALGNGSVLTIGDADVTAIHYAREVGLLDGLREAVRFIREGFDEDSTD